MTFNLFHIKDTPILNGGVGIYESFGSVVVLVATVSSVHKMTFRHPTRIRKEDFDPSRSQDSIPSVFAEASAMTAKENFHIITSTGTSEFLGPSLILNVRDGKKVRKCGGTFYLVMPS